MRQPERPDDADNPLRLLLHRSPRRAAERHEEIERRFGFEIVCGYGLSESTYGLIWPPGDAPVRHPGCGPPAPHARPRERRPGARRRPDADGVGELELRNPAIMRGYYEMPEETAAVLVDGWLRTGDLVHRRRPTAPSRSSDGRRR